MKKIKRIVAIMCVLVVCFTCTIPSAYAAGTPLLGGQQFGALIASGLLSLNIIANTALQSAPIQKLWDWCSAPTAEDRLNYLFPNTGQVISDYMNASTIKVTQGVTTIDGVEYDELWIEPGTFTNGLKTNLFDFKTKWEILSGNAGTLAEGYGYVDGLPTFNVDGTIRTQAISYPASVGSYGLTNTSSMVVSRLDDGRYRMQVQYPDTIRGFDSNSVDYYPIDVYIFYNTAYHQWYFKEKSQKFNWRNQGRYYETSAIEEPFEFNYVSGIVPAEQSDIPDDYGLSLKIPHDKLETFYNTYPEYNISNTTINIAEDEVDIDQLTQAIFDMIDSMEEMKAEWTDGEQPEPPEPVDPVENIDQNVENITQYQQDMQQQVDHMHQDVESIHQTQQAQQQIQQDIAETSESIDNTLKDVKDAVKPGELTPRKFDLRRLFPFCIPFDIHNMLKKFDAEPQAPHVQIPFVIQSIGFSYMIDLDFSAFDGLAQALRTLELVVYCLGLAWATSKVIKW